MTGRVGTPGCRRRTHHVGMVGEGRFVTFASTNGWTVFRAMDGGAPCDFVVDDGTDLIRVEVKRAETARKHAGRNGAARYEFGQLDVSKFDFQFVSTPDGDYWVPVSECPVRLKFGSVPRKLEGFRVDV